MHSHITAMANFVLDICTGGKGAAAFENCLGAGSKGSVWSVLKHRPNKWVGLGLIDSLLNICT